MVEIRDQGLGSSITDIGGGGLSSAVGETAERFNCGVAVDLEKVHLKYQGLTPWEIYLSESQERMLMTVPPENLEKVMAIFEKEDVQAAAIGRLIPERRLQLSYNGELVSDIDMEFLFSPCESTKTATIEQVKLTEPEFPEPEDLTETLHQLLAAPNIASKEAVIRTYDHEVKGNTLLKATPRRLRWTKRCSSPKTSRRLNQRPRHFSCGMNPNYGKIDPYWMAASAIDEAIRNNIAVGGTKNRNS